MPSDHPLTLAELTQFYREVMLPDFERVLGRLDNIDSRLDDMVKRNLEKRVDREPES